MARLARGIDDGRHRTLVDRIERHEVGLLHLREIHPRPRGRKDRNIDRVVAAFLRRQRRVPQHVVGTERTEGNLLDRKSVV